MNVKTVSVVDDLSSAFLAVVIHEDTPFFRLDFILKEWVSYKLYYITCRGYFLSNQMYSIFGKMFVSRIRENSIDYSRVLDPKYYYGGVLL